MALPHVAKEKPSACCVGRLVVCQLQSFNSRCHVKKPAHPRATVGNVLLLSSPRKFVPPIVAANPLRLEVMAATDLGRGSTDVVSVRVVRFCLKELVQREID